MGGMSTLSDRVKNYDWGKSKSVTKRSASSFAKKDARSYTGYTSNGILPPIGKNITTDKELAMILIIDVTGSMKEWPGLIFRKIPTLYNEANVAVQGLDVNDLTKGKLKPENLLDIAVIAIGDAYVDRLPLQVVDFNNGSELVAGVNNIFPEGGGGTFGKESYGLAANYILNHCSVPNAKKKPIVIFACDEDFYRKVKPDHLKAYTGDSEPQNVNADSVMEKLVKEYDVHVLRPEPSGSCEVYDKAQKHWESLVGAQNVYKMENAERLVDCIIGICATASDHDDVGIDLLKRRQTPDQVNEVLRTVYKD